MLPKKLFSALSLVFLVLFTSGFSNAQTDSLIHRPFNRKKWLVIGNSASYVSAMTGLYNLWYRDYPIVKFHFYNDNHEWNQMDKVGHTFSCYYEGVVGIDMLKWAGFSRKKSILIGGAYGFFIQTGIEVMDGFSQEWGASYGDMIANVTGASLCISQSWFWDEQRIWLKFSFQPTHYPDIRPELLGHNFIEHVFKDYNGQTYWLSGNIASFMKPETKFPKWLNMAVGYGMDGFVSSDDNLYYQNGWLHDRRDIAQTRQWYLSPDIDLTRLPFKKRGWKIAMRMLNCIKFPMPAMMWNSTTNDFRLQWVAF
ncbi:MAG: DUF2279 domain-containing protein [Bacteroidetes bacterium]|nr:DUF2279 domain-containing protein [Bacteroidota bacterium]